MKKHIESYQTIPSINIASNSENPTEALLSNLAYAPFEMDNIQYASVEAFWQGLKYSKEEDRNRISKISGIASKKIGDGGDNINGRFIYFGQEYIVGSPEHHGLMYRAIKAKLEQNPAILKLLLDTGNTLVIHEPKKKDGTSYPDSTTIPARVFADILVQLRSELNTSVKIEGIKTIEITQEAVNSVIMEKYIPTTMETSFGKKFAIFTNRELLQGGMRALVRSKIDHHGNKKTPLWEGSDRKIYSTSNHSTPGSFLLVFQDKTKVDAYLQAIKAYGERKRTENFLTPELFFGFEDEEGFNIYIEISHGLMDDDKTTETRFRGLVVYPEGLIGEEIKSIEATQTSVSDIVNSK